MIDPSFSRRVLPSLKAFQRDTVDYVFKRMYEDTPAAMRFLVADEVGLGKTLVARGLVARAIDHLREQGVKRIDIVYICSNSAIARQNIRKLNLTKERVHTLPDRITLLARGIHELRKRSLNFVAFTPGTSFSLKSSLGRSEERVLLHRLLPDDWKTHSDGAISLLAGDAGRRGFASAVRDAMGGPVDHDIHEAFVKELDSQQELRGRFLTLSEQLGRRSCNDDERQERSFLVGRLRSLLAAKSIEALQPDLVILDEFQRFKNLLSGDDPAADLARELFAYCEKDGRQPRVLLLSATPYKMFTTHDEAGGENHFEDFVETVEFLHCDKAKSELFRANMEKYRRGLFRYNAETRAEVTCARQIVEADLRQVMVRTERLAASPDRGGMLVSREAGIPVEVGDLEHYRGIQRIANAVKYGDALEYWKSAPYVLNFMDEYELKAKFVDAMGVAAPERELLDALAAGESALLSRADVEAYRQLDPKNGRLRTLLGDTLGRGTAAWAWMPPSRWYYRPGPPFENADSMDFTKRIVFSGWRVVPKVVSALLSYEAERLLFGEPVEGTEESNTDKARKKRSRRLVFGQSDGRLSGMPVLGMLYPAITLASLCDPLRLAGAKDGIDSDVSSLDEVLTAISDMLAPHVEVLPDRPGEDEDERWYWAAPILLDLHHHEAATHRWFEQSHLASRWRGETDTEQSSDDVDVNDREDRWSAHVHEARLLLEGKLTLGRKPPDLTQMLALLALGSPAVCGLRSLARVLGAPALIEREVRNAAGQIAEGFRSLFNQLELTESIRRSNPTEPYWRRVLEYCANGCLQSVLDEYAHLIADAIGQKRTSIGAAADDIAREMTAAMTLRSASLRADVFKRERNAGGADGSSDPISFRTRYAVRFGSRDDEGDSAERNRKLQDAFNSPFWPFVLCTTSVGQEGLDFHRYCHAVVHWNLPSNPVDLEQREGRVHRYKGHAVRKNVAREHGSAAGPGGDPWTQMFDAARSQSPTKDVDVQPYWIYAPPGGSRIERHVPFHPLSRDAALIDSLRRSLTVYRMAFGQARQEDLEKFLLARLGTAVSIDAARDDLQIDLSPPESANRLDSGVTSEAYVFAASDHDDVEDVGEASPSGATSWGAIRDLLDAFVALKAGNQSGDDVVFDRQKFLDLLDAYVLMKGSAEPPEDMVGKYRELLDRYREFDKPIF